MPVPYACSNCLVLPTVDVVTEHDSLAPRRAATFALLRQALIASMPKQSIDDATPLAPWASPAATGSALVEFWAYAGDIIAQYDRAISNNTRISTTQDRRSLRRIAELLGYQPRPAVGAHDEIAAFVSKGTSIRLSMTTYRAAPLASSASPVFENSDDLTCAFSSNDLALQPVREATLGDLDSDGLLLELSTASPVRGKPVLFSWLDKTTRQHATEIVGATTKQASDAQTYVSLKVAASPQIASSVDLENTALLSPSQRAYARTALFSNEIGPPIGKADSAEKETIEDPAGAFGRILGRYNGSKEHLLSADDFTNEEKTQSTIDLDSVYRSISTGNYVVLQYNAYFSAHLVTHTEEKMVDIKSGPGSSINTC